jgi:hypothetical protein
MEDPQIEELKELVRQNIKLTQDTNNIVHKMRAASRLKSLFWFLILCLSIGSSIYTYFYFVEPRINQIKKVYETNIGPLQETTNNISNFLKNFQGTTTTPTQ